jgi:uncharacterized protein YciI
MKISSLIFSLLLMINVANAQDETLFICKLTIGASFRTTPPDELKKLINSHAQYLDQLGNDGILVFAGRTKLEPFDPKNYGVVVIKALNAKEVETIQDKDPAVKAGLHTWEVLPFSMGIRHFNNLSSEKK